MERKRSEWSRKNGDPVYISRETEYVMTKEEQRISDFISQDLMERILESCTPLDKEKYLLRSGGRDSLKSAFRILPPLGMTEDYSSTLRKEEDRRTWNSKDSLTFSGGDFESISESKDCHKEEWRRFPKPPVALRNWIPEMNREVVDWFEVQFQRTYWGTLLESAGTCIVVFIDKDGKGPQSLVIFKEVNNRCVVKCNRLVTSGIIYRRNSSIVVKIEGKNGWDFQPGPKIRLAFRSEKDTSRFLKTLRESMDIAKKKLTGEERIRFFSNPTKSRPKPEVEMSRKFPTTKLLSSASLQAPLERREHSLHATIYQILENGYSKTSFGFLESTFLGKPCHSSTILGPTDYCSSSSLDFLQETIFERSEMKLYVKLYSGKYGYTELGKGELSVCSRTNGVTSAPDEIIFCGDEASQLRDGICSQFFYCWNKVRTYMKRGIIICKWTTTAAISKGQVGRPTINHFKVEFEDIATAEKFVTILKNSMNRCRVQKVHVDNIKWLRTNRGAFFHH